MSLRWRSARKVRIHCPIAHATLLELLKGNLAAIEDDPVAAKMLAVIRGPNPLGDFDVYQGVFEISFGVEGFTATERATPTAGVRGRATLSPTAVITTYVDAAAAQSAVSAALDALVAAHPWETPVIELGSEPVRLPTRK